MPYKNITYSNVNHLNKLIEGLDYGVLIVELIYQDKQPSNLKILKTNELFQETTGLFKDNEPEKLVTELIDIINQEEFEDWIKIYDTALKSGKAQSFEKYSNHVGKWFWYKVIPLDNNTVTTLTRDITHQKGTELKLKKTSDELETVNLEFDVLLDSMADGVIYQNKDFKVEYFNQRALEILNISENQLMGLSNYDENWYTIREDYSYFPPEEHPSIISSKTGQSFENVIMGLHLGNNTYKWISISSSPIRNKKGEISGVIAIFRDIDELKQNQEKLARTNEELREFTYVISHDLHEPLRMVAGFTNLLKKEYRDQLDTTGIEYLEYAYNGAKRMQRMIDDLLKYSRIGTISEERDKVNIKDMAENVIKLYSSRVKEIEGSIKNDLNDIYLPVVPSLIQRVFQNLIENAIKFRRDQPLSIELGSIEEVDKVVFHVKDNGQGISEKDEKKIFRIFGRASKEPKGSGIGLAISKRIVEKHGGTIWFTSNEPYGTVFYFTIPVK